MRNILSLLIVSILVLGGLGAAATAYDANSNVNIEKESIIISEPVIIEKDQYVRVSLEEKTSTLLNEGEPVLPVVTRVFTYPFGTKINHVDMSFSEAKEILLSKKIQPGPEPMVPGLKKIMIEPELNKDIYNSEDLYPKTCFSYDVSCGLHDGEHVIILIVQYYPVRYSPACNKIYYSSTAEIEVTYEEPPSSDIVFKDEYDLLIIAPRDFSSGLQSFVSHKESHGIRTILVDLDEIYGGSHFSVDGRDDAEKVKYFIKNAVEEWGIKYVLLVGGRMPGIKERWFLPVRYIDVFWADEYDYVSDLYFADIYDGESSFSSWDTDGNDVFGEWPRIGSLKDDMDLYPDVYLGRWPCRNKLELKIMVRKTMSYENSQSSKKVVLVGGDNFDVEGNEGDIVCDKTHSYLPGFEAEKVYPGMMDITPDAIKNALGDGAAFIHLHGHGSPISWSTHKQDDFDNWEEGVAIYNLPTFFNREYPIAVIGGCHTAMFNVSLTIHPWVGIPAPEGLSWWFARKIGGGAIASLGYTCFPVATPGEEGDLDGDGVNDPDCAESGYGYMQLQLFYAYGMEGKEFLGECWDYAVNKYSEQFKIPYRRYHLHTISGFVLLGDPSLKIGGYASTPGFKAMIKDDNGGVNGYPNIPVQLHASVSNGQQPYTYKWDFDEDGVYDDASSEIVEWTWSETGVYWVSVKVTDDNDNEDTYSTIVYIETKPDKPSGPTSGKSGVEYIFTAKVTNDPSWNQIYYYFDWGDGTFSDTLEPYSSDTTIEVAHTWKNSGSYQIRVKALLINLDNSVFEETGWSDSLSVSMPRNKAVSTPFFNFLQNHPILFQLFQRFLRL